MRKIFWSITVCTAIVGLSLFGSISFAQLSPELGSSDAMVDNQLTSNQLPASIWTRIADITEGGRLDTDFNANWLAEWWYLNGKARLISMNGEQRDLGFFVVVGHQESAEWLNLPLFPPPNDDPIKLSQLFHFYGLYFEDGTEPTFCYTETYIPRYYVGNFIALRTPYVDFKYYFDNDRVRMHGSGLYGYRLNYIPHDTGLAINLFFCPRVIKTIDQADYPLAFNTYERAYGCLHGSISLEGKTYWVTSGEGYFDHMMPRSLNEIWTREFHGWNWLEVTSESYQAIFYGTRTLEQGYDGYSFKQLTILDKGTGEVLAEFFGDEVEIVENGWEDWPEDTCYKRPTSVDISTTVDETKIHVDAETVNVFDARKEHPLLGPIGFVDFMAYQPHGATVQCKGGAKESGNSFSEYLVTVPPPEQ